MGIFDKLKTVLNEVAQEPAGKVTEGKVRANVKKQTPNSKKPSDPPAPKSKKPKAKKPSEDPEKAKATKKGEPWVKVLSMELDPNDPGMGAFELDWNDKFVANLIRAGYQGKTDQDIVDNWFQSVCRNVVMETYQQEMADPTNRPNNRRDLGNGRTEIS